MRYAKLALALCALSLLGATVSGTWGAGGGSCPGISKSGAACQWTYTSSNDSPIIQANIAVTICLDSDTAADGTGAAELYVRRQAGGQPDENVAHRIKDSAGSFIVLSAANPCDAFAAGGHWMESKTACGATCIVTVTGRSD